jgi:hypothetical protein
MKRETKVDIDLYTLQLAVAYLLAQEAKRSSASVKGLQEAMVSHLIGSTQTAGQDHPQEALIVEVALTQSVDRLFSVVKSFHL